MLIFRFGLIVVSVAFAASIPAYTYLLAFVGSIAGISLEFVFPPLFRMKIYRQDMSWFNFFVEAAVLVAGLVVLILGTIFSLRSMIQVYSQPISEDCA